MRKKYYVNTADTVKSQQSRTLVIQRAKEMETLDIEVSGRQTHNKLILEELIPTLLCRHRLVLM